MKRKSIIVIFAFLMVIVLSNIGYAESNKLVQIISNPYVSSIFLTLGLVGLVIEILTPGFGLGGTISIIGFGFYFGGNILAGNSHWTSLLLFVIGLILLVVEGMIPGFGLPGISGVILVGLGTVLAMSSLSVALLSLSIAIIITTIVTVVLVKMGFKSSMLDKIILNTEQKDESGYLSTDSMDEYIGREGTSLTELRPSGFIDIDGKKLDALSDSGLIPKNAPIKVVRVEGSKIFVRGF
ncbi:NfeD family protein [Tissierella sp.]|uniref:NfeD family protein n=1 Tax=Tissierella sp. TaxID=41274 RepID=UPI002862D9B0|nr:NfeD family protein [Tissierella sp.]MDR7857115.1 NfeD family protein [Tissierella sp.]